MLTGGSITCWLDQLKEGDDKAAQPLWNRYFSRLVQLARDRLARSGRRFADEEDVALSAFDSFCRDAQRGRFPALSDRHDLWRLLISITCQKAVDLMRREGAAKRGGDQLMDNMADLSALIDGEPTPEFAAMVAEEFQMLLNRLEDAELKAIALRKLEGYTNEEIAKLLDCVPRTIERRLQLIRGLWAGEKP